MEWRAVYKNGELILVDQFSKTSHTFTKNPRVIAEAVEDFVTQIGDSDLNIDWQVGIEYEEGDYVIYKDTLYEVIQAHVSQSDWTPDIVPALFKTTLPESVMGEWKQPAGAHDAYNKGDKVLYNGIVWVSKIDANTTIPDGDEPYNRYWEPE